MEFPLSLTDSERRVGARPMEFPLSLTDSERRGGARPMEFPLSLTDSERRGDGFATPRGRASYGVPP